MKKYINIVLSCFILLFATSCNDWLDLQPSTSMVDEGESMKLLTDVNARLNGVYNQMRAYEYYGARMTYYGDACSEDMQAVSATKRVAAYYVFSYNKENAPSSFWSNCYSIIKNCNIILAGIDGVEVKSDAEKATLADYKGQALTIRALAYFDLTRLYGYPYAKDNGASLAAPIVDTPVEAGYKPARNTVAECYTFIIKDLETAKDLLGEKKNNGRFTKWGAMSLLSRVYLYKGDDANALSTAKAAIAGAEANSVKLWTATEYKTAWATEFSGEVLFELQLSVTENVGNEAMGYLVNASGYDDIVISDDWMVKLMGDQTTDLRYTCVQTDGGKGSKAGLRYLWKYPVQSGESALYLGNIKVLRLSETYLIAAEAAAKLGQNDDAVKYLNAISTRGLTANTFAGKTVTVDDVLTERRKELIGEGHRFFDAIRNHKHIVRSKDNTYKHLSGIQPEAWDFDWSYFKVVLAVPVHEINANENIGQQNPGY
ncbi:membrane protein [Bacteroidia bacterium]|nr:membrane protein [Bacteroidia bacterium]